MGTTRREKRIPTKNWMLSPPATGPKHFCRLPRRVPRAPMVSRQRATKRSPPPNPHGRSGATSRAICSATRASRTMLPPTLTHPAAPAAPRGAHPTVPASCQSNWRPLRQTVQEATKRPVNHSISHFHLIPCGVTHNHCWPRQQPDRGSKCRAHTYRSGSDRCSLSCQKEPLSDTRPKSIHKPRE